MDRDEILQVLEAFERAGLEYVLIGATAAEIREFEGVRVSVATPRALYLSKRSTLRPLDRRDAEALRHHFGLEEDA